MAEGIFKRLEIKYLLSEDQYIKLRKRLAHYMQDDEYGLSTISSIYYDTDNYDVIRTSLEKPEYKEKLRLRVYGEVKPDSTAFLELKKKYDGVVYKRRITLKLNEALNYLNNGIYPSKDSQILREIDYFIKYYRPTKKTYIAYDRIAMYGLKDPDLRITFDKEIPEGIGKSDEKGIQQKDGCKGCQAACPHYLSVNVHHSGHIGRVQGGNGILQSKLVVKRR